MIIVGLLKLGTEIHAHSELIVSITRVFALDCAEDTLRADLIATLLDYGVANLADEHKQAGWCVVVLRVGPNQQNGVHDGDKALSNFWKLVRVIVEIIEVLFKGTEILGVLISLYSCDVDIFLELAESASLSRLVLFQELKNLLDALASELLADRVQVRALVVPEGELGLGTGVNFLL